MVNIIPTFMPSPVRLIHVGLALSLLPVLLVLLAVDALGKLVLAARGSVCVNICSDVCAPRDRVGQEIFRS